MVENWARLIPLAFGMTFLIRALRERTTRRRLLRDGAHAEGRIIAQRTKWGRDRDADLTSTEAPVVEFVTEDGSTVRAASSTSKSHSGFVPGRRVRLRYDHHDPSRILIPAYEGAMATVFVLIGLTVTVIGAIIALWPVLDPDPAEDLLVLVFPSVALAVGLLTGGIGLTRICGILRTRSGPRSTGTVIGDNTSNGQKGMTLHHAVVRWAAPGIGTMEAPTTRGRIWTRHEVGQEVTVYQHPDDPYRILLTGDGPEPTFGCFLLFGLFCLVLGGGALFLVLG